MSQLFSKLKAAFLFLLFYQTAAESKDIFKPNLHACQQNAYHLTTTVQHRKKLLNYN